MHNITTDCLNTDFAIFSVLKKWINKHWNFILLIADIQLISFYTDFYFLFLYTWDSFVFYSNSYINMGLCHSIFIQCLSRKIDNLCFGAGNLMIFIMLTRFFILSAMLFSVIRSLYNMVLYSYIRNTTVLNDNRIPLNFYL